MNSIERLEMILRTIETAVRLAHRDKKREMLEELDIAKTMIQNACIQQEETDREWSRVA